MADINLTARAAKRINEIMGAEPPGSSLRISVNGGGCSGFSYAFDITSAREGDDVVIDVRGRDVTAQVKKPPFVQVGVRA